MKQETMKVTANRALTDCVMEMRLEGDTAALTKPGQFINIRLDGLYLRRPISVCDYGPDGLTIVYKKVGKGTEQLAAMTGGETLDVLVGLGNGYDTSPSGEAPLLLGGGVGIPPLYRLAKCLLAEGKAVTVILGFNTAAEVFYQKEFEALGAAVTVCTADGSYGEKGFVTDVMKHTSYSYFYTCGPMPMFRAIEDVAGTGGQFSFEERMGCGFGACMGCSCRTKYGYKRICRDGPVLTREEIVW